MPTNHKTPIELDLDQSHEMAVLKVGNGTARCRPLGETFELTLRTPEVYGLAPGEIVTVRGRKQWRYAGHLYLTGSVIDQRLNAANLGLTPIELREQGRWDPVQVQWNFADEYFADDYLVDVQRVITTAGPRISYCMEMVTPLRDSADPADDNDAIIEAVELRTGGDFEGARKILMELLGVDLRCLDAHAHLGNFIFDDWPSDAIRHYAAGVEIGNLSLPKSFNGLLPWGRIPNRPFLRCLHGYGLCLWRLERVDEARAVFERMLWLNPNDNQGARSLVRAICNHERWHN